MSNYTTQNGELRHWKYIRRTRNPDGSWRYYYEKDNNKIRQVGVSKGYSETKRVRYTAEGKRQENTIFQYWALSPETGNKYKIVDKATYDKIKNGKRLYVGNTPLGKLAKEQINMGIAFIKDFFKSKGKIKINKRA